MKSQLSLASGEMEGSDLPRCNWAIDSIPICALLNKSFHSHTLNCDLAHLIIVL